ncbi:MAG: hypothetical protein ACLS37_14095 [Alistipes sp.]
MMVKASNLYRPFDVVQKVFVHGRAVGMPQPVADQDAAARSQFLEMIGPLHGPLLPGSWCALRGWRRGLRPLALGEAVAREGS